MSDDESPTHNYNPDHPVRPILKRKPSLKETPKLKWDEETIAEQEAERIANPKMKIDEPPTPYAREGEGGEIEDEPENGEGDGDLQARLVMAAASLNEGGESTSTPERPQSAERFKEMRKAVYADEGAKFKELLKKGAALDDEDEDEE